MPPKKPNLTQQQRDEIVTFLCDRATNTISEDGSVVRWLPKGIFKQAAQNWDVHRNTIHNIWKSAKDNFNQNRVMKSVSKIKENSGRKQKWNREEVKEAIRENCSAVDLKTLEGILKRMSIPYGSVHNMIRKEHLMVRKNDIVKPYLKDYYLADRFAFAAAQLLRETMTYRDHSRTCLLYTSPSPRD